MLLSFTWRKLISNEGVLFAGYKQYDTGRQYMAKMGDWRDDAHKEIELDGIGGVNILVKADVHRSGKALLVRNGILI